MTVADFKTEIAWEGKLNGETEGLNILVNIIRDCAMILVQSHPELFATTSEPVVGPTTFFTLQANVLSVTRVEYTTSSNDPYELPHRNQVVGMAPVEGKPNCYNLTADGSGTLGQRLKLELIPNLGINIADTYVIEEKLMPVIEDDDDQIPDAWIPFITKSVLARLAVYRSENDKLQAAQLYSSGTQQTLQVEMANDAESKAATS